MIAKITPFTPNGCITAPPSKSVAHRLIILAALKNGRTEIYGVGKSDDVIATLNCVKNLGAKVEIFDDFVAIEGIKDVLVASKLPCNESGSTLRFMIPVSCALGANATFLGTEKLLSRPNEKLFDLLLAKGIKINGYNFEGKLSAGKYEIDSTISSQYITGLLLALPNLEGDSQIVLKGETVSKDYINITLSTMDLAQIKYKKTADSFIVYGNQKSNLPDRITVEGDWSNAAFLLVLGAIKGEITVKNLSLNSKQGDRKILQLLTDIGANVKIKGEQITVKESKLSAFEIDCQDIPDLAPIICV
ncbi:MAG: 3-phosphoshikimate 1-carboxyvinyltransferase, partial [Clostridia bacterium]|nr:3-phosphoshikimate 1-carboxyvinyltransferase [Clostridia bacterium]